MSTQRSVHNDVLSFNGIADIICDFLEVSLHTILFLRGVYHPDTFARVKSYDVPVYQSRHPQVRQYLAGVVRAVGKELQRATIQRLTLVIKSVSTGEALERYVFELGYMDLRMFSEEGSKDRAIDNAPTDDDLHLMLQAFLTRLLALEGQLVAFSSDEELTYAIAITCKEGEEPDLTPVIDHTKYDGKKLLQRAEREPAYNPDEGAAPWAPATKMDALHPPSRSPSPAQPGYEDDGMDIEGPTSIGFDGAPYKGKGKGRAGTDAPDGMPNGRSRKKNKKGEPMFAVKSFETGVIDLNLMVQECVSKRKMR